MMPPLLTIGQRTANSPPEAVIEQRVFSDAAGRTVVHRTVVIPGELPENFGELVGVFSFQFKTPAGLMPYRMEIPFDKTEVKTLADAFMVYDAVAKVAQKAAIDEIEGQARRAALSGGLRP